MVSGFFDCLNLDDGTDMLSETSTTNYNSTLRKMSEECRCQISTNWIICSYVIVMTVTKTIFVYWTGYSCTDHDVYLLNIMFTYWTWFSRTERDVHLLNLSVLTSRWRVFLAYKEISSYNCIMQDIKLAWGTNKIKSSLAKITVLKFG